MSDTLWYISNAQSGSDSDGTGFVGEKKKSIQDHNRVRKVACWLKVGLSYSRYYVIHSDILASMDAGKVTALTLLELSAAFDTLDHTILLRRLDDWFWVTGKTLDWFKSYLTGRCQRIRLGDCLSSKADLKFGVPKVSVLGPLHFTLDTTPFSRMISEHAMSHHFHADDSHLCVSFSSGDSTAAIALVFSRLDYCNSLLYVIACIDLARLQHVQNRLALLVTKSPPFTRSLPLLRSFHWLPVRFRILL